MVLYSQYLKQYIHSIYNSIIIVLKASHLKHLTHSIYNIIMIKYNDCDTNTKDNTNTNNRP